MFIEKSRSVFPLKRDGLNNLIISIGIHTLMYFVDDFVDLQVNPLRVYGSIVAV